MARAFDPSPIPEDVVNKLLVQAARAPSAGFTQGIDLLTLVSPQSRARFWEAASSPRWRSTSNEARSLSSAPVLVLPIADPAAYVARYEEPDKASSGIAGLPADRWEVPYWTVDASFVVMSLLLGATDAGLGALFFRLHRPTSEVLASLGIPTSRVAIGAVALGRAISSPASGSPTRRARRPIDQVVHLDHW